MYTTSLSMLSDIRHGGRNGAWGRFVQTYAPMLLSIAKRCGLSDAEAADAGQETLLAVHQAATSEEKPLGQQRGRFRYWLRRVAKNKVIDVVRQRQPTISLDEPGLVDGADIERVFDEEWERSLLDRALAQVRQEVSPVRYQAFELYAVQGVPPKDVAKLLEISRNAVFISKCKVLRRLCEIGEALRREEG